MPPASCSTITLTQIIDFGYWSNLTEGLSAVTRSAESAKPSAGVSSVVQNALNPTVHSSRP
eukprot:scaffold146004_cov30-Tisochrysis_lutea.AAC.1